MNNVTIGYIFDSFDKDIRDEPFINIAKKKKINIVPFNLRDEFSEEEIEKKAEECGIIFNNTAGYGALEIVKTLEELGKKIVDGSKIYYYSEDKWMFYLKCMKNKIPTPETILLSEDINSVKKELENFNHWPVVLKRVEGEMGEFVEKADNMKEVIEVLKRFWDGWKNIRIPIIAQELVKSCSYRVTVLDGKIIQTALKDGHGWKATGEYAKKFEKFEVDEDLEKLVNKIARIAGIKICGIDFLKKDGKWLALEVNAEPAFDFFENEYPKIVEEVLDFIIKEAEK